MSPIKISQPFLLTLHDDDMCVRVKSWGSRFKSRLSHPMTKRLSITSITIFVVITITITIIIIIIAKGTLPWWQGTEGICWHSPSSEPWGHPCWVFRTTPPRLWPAGSSVSCHRRGRKIGLVCQGWPRKYENDWLLVFNQLQFLAMITVIHHGNGESDGCSW